MFDRTGELGDDLQLRFHKDDVLYVDNTMFNGIPGNWRAWLVDQDGYQHQCGIIPSKYKWVFFHFFSFSWRMGLSYPFTCCLPWCLHAIRRLRDWWRNFCPKRLRKFRQCINPFNFFGNMLSKFSKVKCKEVIFSKNLEKWPDNLSLRETFGWMAFFAPLEMVRVMDVFLWTSRPKSQWR